MKYVFLISFLFCVQANAAKPAYKTARAICPPNKVMFFLDGRNQCLDLDGPITENPVDALTDSRIDRYISNETTELNALK